MPARPSYKELCKHLFSIKNITISVMCIAVGVVLVRLTNALAVSSYVFALLVMFIFYNFRELREGIISCCLYTSGDDEPYRPDDDDAPQEEPEVPNYARREEPEVRNSTGPTNQEEVVADVPPAYNDVISSETSPPSYTEALENITV